MITVSIPHLHMSCLLFVVFSELIFSSQNTTHRCASLVCIMSRYAENWATTPWQAPEPSEAVQHFRSLLCKPEEESGDQNIPRKVCSVVGGILDNIEEKIKTHCKYKHLIHVEHQVDASSGRDLAWTSNTTRILVMTRILALKEYTTIGRRLMLSTSGSKRYGKPRLHGR